MIQNISIGIILMFIFLFIITKLDLFFLGKVNNYKYNIEKNFLSNYTNQYVINEGCIYFFNEIQHRNNIICGDFIVKNTSI